YNNKKSQNQFHTEFHRGAMARSLKTEKSYIRILHMYMSNKLWKTLQEWQNLTKSQYSECSSEDKCKDNYTNDEIWKFRS
ncbi:MAG: hypothetical protein RIT37_768, partial [Bacteroidota bacterium]